MAAYFSFSRLQHSRKGRSFIFFCPYRVRKLHQAERQTLAEKKEQRKEEKQRQRIEEIEYEIQQRKDEEAR